MKDIFEEFVKEVILGEGKNKEKRPIGSCSEETRLAYRQMNEDKEDLEAEIEFRVNREVEKVKRRLYDEYYPVMSELEGRKEKLWKAIREELIITNDEIELNINTKTGIISELVEKD